jgi:nucleotide-binding universal stress UspA family protein
MAADQPSTAEKCIVVGYDGSELSQAAIAAAREQAGAGGKVIVVQAYGLPPDFLGWAEYDGLLTKRQSHARAVLDELVRDHADTLGANHEIELIGGSPAQALLDVARARHADAIVVGSRGLGRVKGAIGSVSQRLLHLADVPVMVIPSGDADE